MYWKAFRVSLFLLLIPKLLESPKCNQRFKAFTALCLQELELIYFKLRSKIFEGMPHNINPTFLSILEKFISVQQSQSNTYHYAISTHGPCHPHTHFSCPDPTISCPFFYRLPSVSFTFKISWFCSWKKAAAFVFLSLAYSFNTTISRSVHFSPSQMLWLRSSYQLSRAPLFPSQEPTLLVLKSAVLP